MRRFAPLALLVAASSIVGVSAAEPAPAPALELVKRADFARPWMLRGELTPPSKAAPLAIAHEALRRHAAWATKLELAHAETTKLPDGGNVVGFQQTIDGVPVLHRGVRVTIESDGHASAVATTLEENRPASMRPAITEKRAIAAAARLGVPANALGARLMVLPSGSQPMLVWGVVGDLGTIPSRPVVLLDAQTGEVALRYDAALQIKKAKVYVNNPVRTPELTEVTLTNDATLPGLANAVVTSVNCIDKKTTKSITFPGVPFPINLHVCEFEPTIAPDSTSDYLDIAPVTSGPGAAEDKYAELSMFYHTDKAYEFVRKVGFPESRVAKIRAAANVRIPQGIATGDIGKAGNPELPLAPFDNAIFASEDPLLGALGLTGDVMAFGQGTLADFGYDGDVVYHEFGHFTVSRTIALGGGAWSDQFGLTFSPGGLNESIADIISFFITDDPELGEYTTTGLGLPKGKGLRSATNTFKFPDAITGEVHQDAEPQTAAVWSVYSKLDATKKLAFQKAFMKTLVSAPKGNLGYADFAELVIRDVTSGVDAPTGTALRAAFEERGIKKDDPRVRTWSGQPVSSVDPRLGIHAAGLKEMVGGNRAAFAPGLFQIAYDAPAGGITKIHVEYKLLARGGTFGSGTSLGGGSEDTPYTPALLVKTGGEPIKFTYGPFAHDATTTDAIDCVVAGDKKSATCDAEIEVTGNWGETSKLHLMLVNKGQTGGEFDAVTVTAEGPPEPAAPEQPATPPTQTVETTTCNCSLPGGTSNGTTAGLALGALGLVLAARRRR